MEAEYASLTPPPADGAPVIGKSGTEYRWLTGMDLPSDRYVALGKLQIEFAYDAGFESLNEYDNKMYAYANASKFVEVAHELMKRREGIVNLKNGRNGGIEVVALFLIGPGEPLEYNEETQKAKIQDLATNGIGVSWYFNKAADVVSGFRAAYLDYIQTFSAPLN